MQALSPVGRCQTFEAAADGYGRGEGFASVVMCQAGTLPDWRENAEQMLLPMAVVAGSAVNQDGRSSSLTAPNGPSQTVRWHSLACPTWPDVNGCPGTGSTWCRLSTMAAKFQAFVKPASVLLALTVLQPCFNSINVGAATSPWLVNIGRVCLLRRCWSTGH